MRFVEQVDMIHNFCAQGRLITTSRTKTFHWGMIAPRHSTLYVDILEDCPHLPSNLNPTGSDSDFDPSENRSYE